MNRTRTLDPQDTAARIRETQERVRREGFGFMICDRTEWDKAPIEFRRMAAQQVIRERLRGLWAWTERDGIQCAEHPLLGYFVFLPGFWTQIGSPENEEGRYSDEGPMYRIYVEPFFMGMHNVTERAWNQVLASERIEIESNLPKTMISWLDSKAWMEKASAIAGVEITFPWEEEWEGACRAGSTTPYFWGTDPAMADQYAWHAGNSGGRVHEVGELKPNAWGLYDMIGNVWEWCRDEWTPDHSAKAATADGVAKARMAAAAAKFSLRSQAIRVEPNAQSASRWALPFDVETTEVRRISAGQPRDYVTEPSATLVDGCPSAPPSTSNAQSASRLALAQKDSTQCTGPMITQDKQVCSITQRLYASDQKLKVQSRPTASASPSTSNALEAKEVAPLQRVGIGGGTEHTISHLSERQFSLTPNAPGSHSASPSTSNALVASELALSSREAAPIHIHPLVDRIESALVLCEESLACESQSTYNAQVAKEEALSQRAYPSILSPGSEGSADLPEPPSGHRAHRSVTTDSTTADSASPSTSNADAASRFCLPSSAEDAETGLAHRGDCRDTPKDQSSRRTLASESPSTCNSVEAHNWSFSKSSFFYTEPLGASFRVGCSRLNRADASDTLRLVIHI